MRQTRLPTRARRSHPHKPRPLEEGIHVSHLRQRFDPPVSRQLGAPPNERRRQPCTPVRRMQHHPAQQHQLPVHRPDRRSLPPPRSAEVPVSRPQRQRRRHEHAHPHRLRAVPQQRHEPCQPDVVASIMPPSEVRPVALGRRADPQLLPERQHSFFLRSVPALQHTTVSRPRRSCTTISPSGRH